MRSSRATGITLLLCLAASQAALLVLTPVLASVADGLDVSTAVAGQLRTISGLAAGATALLAGLAAARFGLRRLIGAGLALVAIGSGLSAAAPSFAFLGGAQFVIGAGIGLSYTAAVAAVAEWSSPTERSRVLALALLGPPLAWVVGMPVAGAVGDVSWRLVWVVVPLALAVVALLALRGHPGSAPAATRAGLRDVFSHPGVLRWSLGELFAYSAWAGALVFMGALFIESYDLSITATGLVLGVGALVYLPGNLLFRRLVDEHDRALLIGLPLAAAATVALLGAWRPSVWASLVLFATLSSSPEAERSREARGASTSRRSFASVSPASGRRRSSSATSRGRLSVVLHWLRVATGRSASRSRLSSWGPRSLTSGRVGRRILRRHYPDGMEVADTSKTAFQARIAALEESLSPFAVRSLETRGRERHEEPCAVRTPFQRDRDRIVHSKPFRRLKGKTQVFIDPEGDHYRTRMTHTLETTAISRVVARALRLNEDLTEAIGLGHDMGHTPFGHAGEDALDAAVRGRFGTRFRHNEHSHRIARSLNLTYEVCDGILTHTGEREPESLEGRIVRLVDRVAYINHDIDDAVRYGLLTEADLPREEIAVLGASGSARIDRLVHDIVETSEGVGDIRQSAEVGEAMLSLRGFMFERVYLGPQAAPEHERAHEVIGAIFEHLAVRGDDVDEIVDYIAGMTDRFALAYAESL